MLYDYHYNVAGMIAIAVLLFIFLCRRNYSSHANRIFEFMLLGCLGCAFADYTTVFTISYPDRYPEWILYLSSCAYVLLYNWMACCFLVYCTYQALPGDSRKVPYYAANAAAILEFILIATTFKTHLILYFDEEGNYLHGPLMILLYIISMTMLVVSLGYFIARRKNFSRFQVSSIVVFVTAMIFCVIFQVINPKYLVGEFGSAMILFMLYSAFENPAYYTFRDSNCYNKNAFVLEVQRLLASKRPFTIINFFITDYEYFKNVLTLKSVEKITSRTADYTFSNFRKNGFCLQEDCFTVLVKGEDRKNAAELAEKIKNDLRQPVEVEGSKMELNISTRIFEPEVMGVRMENVSETIDYLIKNRHETGTVPFADIISRNRRRQEVLHILTRAVENDQLMVYYQPIYNGQMADFTCSEALVRLKDENLGFISPEEFIPLAEEAGLILEIGRQVFSKVCRFIKSSGCLGLGVKRISVNLSTVQCLQSNLAEVLQNIMAEHKIDPECINLEITESAEMVEETNVIASNIKKLGEVGISFSIDDFGSGFASMDYLFRLPVTSVKIDKSILWEAMGNPSAMIILLNTMRMLRELGKKVVVEGVENIEMVNLLLSNGCDYLQGFYYSKPIPENEYIDFLLEAQKKREALRQE